MSDRSYSKWSQEEKDKLIMKITQFQNTNQKLDWTEIQRHIGTKTIRQCYDQYVLLFRKPRKTDTRHSWTLQEERRLVKVFKQNPYQWEIIQKQFTNLNVVQLKNKVNAMLVKYEKSKSQQNEQVGSLESGVSESANLAVQLKALLQM
ncbi:Myb-like_DNA-binding domain-containing protein [Hexamita inflata]|uniref:Myb-like_DNA-binding domain-containing protein n=1 Tax=Hexamita inflata TaxID=28002 RepID=A0ABP1HDS4_9EUKA